MIGQDDEPKAEIVEDAKFNAENEMLNSSEVRKS